jgi:hypothetical protein
LEYQQKVVARSRAESMVEEVEETVQETPKEEKKPKESGPKVPVGLSGAMAATMMGGKAKKKFN